MGIDGILVFLQNTKQLGSPLGGLVVQSFLGLMAMVFMIGAGRALMFRSLKDSGAEETNKQVEIDAPKSQDVNLD